MYKRTYIKRESGNGFTLMEVLIVVAMSILLAGLTLPIGFRFFQSQMLDEAALGVESALDRAGAMAGQGKHDSAFGVKFLSGGYTVFQGVSYALRASGEDENFTLASNIAVLGADEIVFSKIGATTTPASVMLTLGQDTETVSVGAFGYVSRQ
jgi:type II secretory pathway pseudopilin PulG